MSMFLENDPDDGLLNEINMTPLIDVMLVLLIIFIVTLPVMNHAVKVDLPKVAATHDISHEENIDVSVDASGVIFWNKVPVDDAQLAQHVAQAASVASQPIVRIYADRRVAYDRVVNVLAAVQAGGLTRLDFVTDPKVQ
ncbi:biopolymer transporter ExbD [Paraburkholderia sediminicola]|uniref:ExbD/TolR family protein n=1 Tax=Paraburkholderia sediminicola TaxID=458836 RepID=UPI0038B8F9FF